MPVRTDPYFDHTTMVEVVASIGVPPPPAWVALRDRFDAYLNPSQSILNRLTTAVIDGHPDADIPLLKALAAAEAMDPATGGKAVAHLRDRVLHRLRELYGAVVADDYQAVAKQFDDAAKRFTDVANTVYVEGDANDLLLKPDKIRQAYQAAESYANALTRLTVPLAAARTLATGTDVHPSNQLLVLPLCVNVDGHKRRELWTAWDVGQQGRTGRWGSIHRAGIAIRACPLDQPLTEYRRALPIERRQRQQAGAPRGVIEWYMFDPDTDVEAIDPVRRPTGRGVAV